MLEIQIIRAFKLKFLDRFKKMKTLTDTRSHTNTLWMIKFFKC